MPIKMKKLTLCFLLTVSGLMLFGQNVRLSREKQILLLHNIDSLIKKYEFYSSLSEGNKISENQKEKFLSFFLNDFVSVFDDICPNYVNNNESTINEKQKPLSVYIKDISDNYNNLFCRITETDAGTLYSRIKQENEGLVVSVKIKKEIQASSKTAAGARFETTTIQDLVLLIKDTLNCVPLVTEITKSGTSKWNYIAPYAKGGSQWERIISLKAGMANIKSGGQVSLSIIAGPKLAVKPGFGLEGELRYLFKNFETVKIGGSIGLGISFLSASYNADSVKSGTWIAKDKDNEPYYEIMVAKQFKENQSIIGVDIPIKLNYEKSFSLKNGFYLKAGGVLSYYKGSYKMSTTYTSMGYYPQYNITLQEISGLGFNKNQNYSGNGKLSVNPVNVSGNVELGMFFRSGNKSQLYIGVFYNQAFLNMSKKELNSVLLTLNQPDATKPPVASSIMPQFSTVNLSIIGISVGIKRLPKSAGTQKNVNYLKQ